MFAEANEVVAATGVNANSKRSTHTGPHLWRPAPARLAVLCGARFLLLADYIRRRQAVRGEDSGEAADEDAAHAQSPGHRAAVLWAGASEGCQHVGGGVVSLSSITWVR